MEIDMRSLFFTVIGAILLTHSFPNFAASNWSSISQAPTTVEKQNILFISDQVILKKIK